MGGADAGDDGGPDGEYPAALPGHQASRTPAQLAWSTTSTTGSPGAPSRCSSPGAACPSAASASSSRFTPRCGASASSPPAPCRTGGAADGSSLPACGLRPQRSAVIQRRQTRGTKAEWPPRPDGQPSQDGGPAHSASSLNQPQDQLACADHPPATRPAASLGVCRAREVRRFGSDDSRRSVQRPIRRGAALYPRQGKGLQPSGRNSNWVAGAPGALWLRCCNKVFRASWAL